jgi:hypothetical protein
MRLHLGQLELIGQLLFLGLGQLVRPGELLQLQSQRGGQFRLLLGARCVFLQLTVQIFDIGLRGGELLLQLLVLLFALAQLGLLLAGGGAGLRQLLLDLFLVPARLFERLFHDGGQVVAGVRDGIDGDHDLCRRRRAVIRHMVHVRRERQQAQQQEIADDDENAAVHDYRAGVDAAVGGT